MAGMGEDDLLNMGHATAGAGAGTIPSPGMVGVGSQVRDSVQFTIAVAYPTPERTI